FDSQLGFNAEVIALKWNAAQQIGPNHLVTSFHVGEVEVAGQVAEESKEVISNRMAEKQGTLEPTRHKTRTENGIGVLVQKQRNHLQQIARVVLQVGVVNHRQFGVGVAEGGTDRAALSLIALMSHKHPLELRVGRLGEQLGAETLQHVRSGVARAVVHNDHLYALQQRGIPEHQQAQQAGSHQVLLVVDRNQYREAKCILQVAFGR